MPMRILATTAALLVSGLTGGLLAQAKRLDLKPMWTAWKDGDIDVAHRLAEVALAAGRAADEARHALCLTAFVRGDYRGALDHYRAIHAGYRRLAELDDVVLNSHIHLGAVRAALDFAVMRPDVPPLTRQRLEAHVRRPFAVDLTGVTTVPFANHPLSEGTFRRSPRRSTAGPPKRHPPGTQGHPLMLCTAAADSITAVWRGGCHDNETGF